MTSFLRSCTVVTLALMSAACAGPTPGPDKQFEGESTGALAGAGAGAITGFQIGAGTGPGAAVGAGFGAVAGAISGISRDQAEQDLLKLSAASREERELAMVHEILQDHYKRRLELHPTRDIYPADLFFVGDKVELCPSGARLIDEIARLNLRRMPWSRLVVAVYSKSSDPRSTFAQHLVERRSEEIADRLAKSGIDPRRIQTRPVILDSAILIDPLDTTERYAQAVEFIPVDK